MLSTTLSGNYGFPLCISGISRQLSLTKEMADHDKRRKVMKKKRRSEGKGASRRHGAEEEMGVERFHEQLWLQEMRESEDVRDLVALFQDLGSWSFSSHTAKAA
ncbi:uncharacterized protein LOC103845459 [Brassica rapa]|uniref:Uncharacterized protein n=2 Tax=Brassica TaxID=3705 RepID=A0A3P6CRN3_BRACM|nr:uncharacterized protein LOC103845459 [Brassica rapa]XP_013665854.1 uncharacterized protein LOC106370385 [Brassica napus]KAH0906870.1 hypothetical protein HID58_038697 [Brassica napus]CAF2336217.1 unnamed protein product [Brassica napus]CAG7910602.1 unnamed protein product [Brassica rapa]VDD18346.1 unnamed protein product [Brassica rapa]